MEVIWLAIAIIVAAVIFYYIGMRRSNKRWKAILPGLIEEAKARSRPILAGQFSEQLAPYLPNFKWSPTETKYVGGKPIDFIVFKGLDQKEVKEVVFVEVKSGESRLTPMEKTLRDTITAKKVNWEEYRVPHDITSRTQ